MPYPTKYTRQYDYQSYQVSNPTRPLPGNQVNVDLNAVVTSVDELVEFLKTSIRADGRLANGSVGVNQLDDTFNLGFSLPTTWEAGVAYTTDSTVLHDNKFWIANVDHTSTDGFDESKWELIVDFGAQATAAAASATAAAASETAAAASATAASGSATTATTQATNASASATAAATSETNAATSETNAAASETAAATSETNAAASETNAAASAAAAAASAGSVVTTSVNGQTGTVVLMIQPQCRITLTTGVAVMTTSQAAKSTVYVTPTGGNQCPINNGTNFVPTTFTELSQATTDATKSPAAVANNSNYDIFVWNDSGTIRATRGPAWSSNTSRGTGAGTTELDFTTVFPTNKNAITNGPAANRGTWVGTIRSNGTATIDWILGGSGTAAVLGVWNTYNRVFVATTAYESNTTWTYSSATIRQVRGSAVNQVSFVSGLAEDALDASYQVAFNTAAVSGASLSAGLALDSTTTFDKRGVTTNNSSTLLGANIGVRMTYAPQLGYHYISANEAGDGTNTTTFVGTDRNGLSVTTFM